MSIHLMAMPGSSARRSRNVYATEAKYELLRVLRMPAYAVPTLTFPLLFYVMFGLVFGRSQNVGPVNLSTYLLATYGAFGVIGASLFGFAVTVATERGLGWLQVKRASPMPPAAYLFSKSFVSMVFSAIIVTAMIALAVAFGGVRLPLPVVLRFGATLVAGVLPFAAMGLAIGCFCAPSSAPAIVNVLYLPMSFCSGLWLPLPILPKIFQTAAPFLPPYHLAQLALRLVGAPSTGSAMQHVLALLGFTAGFLLLAQRGFAREDGKVNG